MQNPTALETLSENCFNDLVSYIHELTGITVGRNRNTMLQGRLRKRVIELKYPSYEDYLKMVKTNKDEQIVFIDLVTTNETQFFRTPRVWNYLEKTFLPNWFKNNPQKTLQAWSAAASSGEEAYSLAIIFQLFKDKNPGFNYKITGTDISKEMMAACKEGLYTGRSIENFKNSRPADFSKFLQLTSDQHYQVANDIRSKVHFYQHNLFKAFTNPEKFDLVLLRNVMIYFSRPDQEAVLSKIQPRMHEEGVLVIGESESLTHISTGFKPIEPLVYANCPAVHKSEVA